LQFSRETSSVNNDLRKEEKNNGSTYQDEEEII